MPLPLIGWGIKRWCCLTSVWHLSVAYIGPKSRTERPRKTKIGTKVAHVTHDSDTTLRVKRSRSPGCSTYRLLRQLQWSVWESIDCGNILLCCGRLGGVRRFGANKGRRGAGHIVSPCARLVYSELQHLLYLTPSKWKKLCDCFGLSVCFCLSAR